MYSGEPNYISLLQYPQTPNLSPRESCDVHREKLIHGHIALIKSPANERSGKMSVCIPVLISHAFVNHWSSSNESSSRTIKYLTLPTTAPYSTNIRSRTSITPPNHQPQHHTTSRVLITRCVKKYNSATASANVPGSQHLFLARANPTSTEIASIMSLWFGILWAGMGIVQSITLRPLSQRREMLSQSQRKLRKKIGLSLTYFDQLLYLSHAEHSFCGPPFCRTILVEVDEDAVASNVSLC